MNPIGFLYAIAAAVTWGIVYALGQKILQHASPLFYLVTASLIAGILSLPFIFARWDAVQQTLIETKPVWGWILLVEILVFAANFFILASIKELGPALASVIEISYPFFVVLFTYLLFGTTVNIYFWLGAALIFSGAAIISYFS